MMKKKSKWIALLFVLVYVCTLGAVVVNAEEQKDIYLFIGQSNMAGRAEIEQQDLGVVDNAYLLNSAGEWEPAQNLEIVDNGENLDFGFNRYSTIRNSGTKGGIGGARFQGLSPAYMFSAQMGQYAKTKGRSVGVVVNAKGGTSMSSWRAGKDYYNQTIARTKAAIEKGGVLKGILWHQGENDVNASEASYMADLAGIANGLRRELNAPDAFFIAGQLMPGQIKNGDYASTDSFNQFITKISDYIDNSAWVSSEGLTHRGDELHFNSESQRTLGTRYAEKAIELLKAQEYVNLEVKENQIVISSSDAISDAVAVAAEYTGDGTLKKLVSYPVSVKAGEESVYDLDGKFSVGSKVKIFFWNSTSQLQPYLAPVAAEIIDTSVTPEPTVPPKPTPEPVYSDDFAAGNMNGWSTSAGVFSIQEDSDARIGKYLNLKASGENRAGTKTLSSNMAQNFVFEADLKMVSTSERLANFTLVTSGAAIGNNQCPKEGYLLKLDLPKNANQFVINYAESGRGHAMEDFTGETVTSKQLDKGSWVHIKSVCNLQDKTTMLDITSLDGKKEFFSGMVDMHETAANLNKIYLLAPRSNGNLGIDNIVLRAATEDDLNAVRYYTVNIDVNGAVSSHYVKENACIDAVPDPSILGGTFLGWKINNDEKLLTSEELAALPVTGDLTISAQYKMDENYIEDMSSVTFRTLPANDTLIMSDSDAFYENQIALTILGEKGTELSVSPDERVDDFKIDWEFTGFRTKNGEPTTDQEGVFPGTQTYCDSYGKVTVDAAAQAAINFDLKNTPENYFGKVKATVTYNGKTMTQERYLCIFGNKKQESGVFLPRSGYFSDYNKYEDGLEGYTAIDSPDGKSGFDSFLGGWMSLGSNATRSLQLIKEGEDKFLQLSKSTSGGSAFAMNILDAANEQVFFDQQVRFNTSSAQILYKSEAPNLWTDKTAVNIQFDDGKFLLNGTQFASGEQGTWYRLLISADPSSQKCSAKLYTAQGTLVGESNTVAFANQNVTSPQFYALRISDSASGSLDFNKVEAKKAVIDESTFEMEIEDAALTIPAEGTVATNLSVTAKSVEGYDITGAVIWSVDDELAEGITITADSSDSHKAVLTVSPQATSGEIPVKAVIGGQSVIKTIKLIGTKETIAFKQAPQSICIPLDGQEAKYAFVAEVRNGQGEEVPGKTVTYEMYDADNQNPAIVQGITLNPESGQLSVAPDALASTVWIRANGQNSEGQPISKAVKVTVYGLKFRFGAEPAAGETKITPDTLYTEAKGYGLSGSTQNSGSSLTGGDFSFKAKVLPGKVYHVTIEFKGKIALEKFNQYLSGVVLDSYTHSALTSQTYEIAVTGDGVLDINFVGQGEITSVTVEKQQDKTKAAKPTWISIGDSTVAQNPSWAYVLKNTWKNYPEIAAVIEGFENKGRGARNLTSYYNEGLLDGVLRTIKPGDVVSLSGMGTNGYDGGIAGFKEQANYYIDSMIQMGAYVVIGSYTPNGNWGAFQGKIYDPISETFRGKRYQDYDVALYEIYRERKEEPNILGYVDIGQIADDLMTGEVAKAKQAVLDAGGSVEDAKQAADAKAQEMLKWFRDDSNHYTGELSNLILPEVTRQVAEQIKTIS